MTPLAYLGICGPIPPTNLSPPALTLVGADQRPNVTLPAIASQPACGYIPTSFPLASPSYAYLPFVSDCQGTCRWTALSAPTPPTVDLPRRASRSGTHAVSLGRVLGDSEAIPSDSPRRTHSPTPRTIQQTKAPINAIKPTFQKCRFETRRLQPTRPNNCYTPICPGNLWRSKTTHTRS